MISYSIRIRMRFGEFQLMLLKHIPTFYTIKARTHLLTAHDHFSSLFYSIFHKNSQIHSKRLDAYHKCTVYIKYRQMTDELQDKH